MLIYPDIDPVALDLGVVQVHWYGISYLAGFLGAWWLAGIRSRAFAPGLWDRKAIDDLMFYGIVGVIAGGRIGYILFYGFDSWMNDPLRLFRVWEGGMSFHGGLLGVLIAMSLFARRYGKGFFEVTDFIAPLVPVGLFTGRLGNFINGELWGAPADLPWAMQVSCERFYSLCFDKLQLPPGSLLTPPLHPNQLYEALFEGILLFTLLWLYARKPRQRMAVSGLFMLGYGSIRFLIEFVRMPDAHLGYLFFDWVTMGQVLSLPMIVIGVWLFWLSGRKAGGNAVS